MKFICSCKRWIFLSVFTIISVFTHAQIKGISYTFSPAGEYLFFHKNSGMGDGLSYGGQLGFGFGEYLQLNAIYLQTPILQTDFSGLTSSSINPQDFSLNRIGGELKANITRKKLSPYLAFGTGIQTVDSEINGKSKQIYLSSGLGLNLRFDDRVSLALALMNYNYRINPYQSLLPQSEKDKIDPSDLNSANYLVSDFALQTKLSFFLGGQRPGNLSELDKAYMQQFSNGFKGLSVPVEATVAYFNFNDKLSFNDGFYNGLSAGFDFGPYVGIRGFYLRSMEDGLISAFGKSAIWGGETKFKLNTAEGAIPYITLGGGKLEARNGYLPDNGLTPENKVFASGGMGIEMPLSRNIKIIGFVNGIMTSVSDVTNTSKPEDLVTSISYGAKLGFVIGKKPESAQALLNRNLEELKLKYSEEQQAEIAKVVNEYELLLQQKDQQMAQKPEPKDSALNAPEKSIIRVSPDELIAIIRELKSPASVPAISTDIKTEVVKEKRDSLILSQDSLKTKSAQADSVGVSGIVLKTDSVSLVQNSEKVDAQSPSGNALTAAHIQLLQAQYDSISAKINQISLNMAKTSASSVGETQPMDSVLYALRGELNRSTQMFEDTKQQAELQKASQLAFSQKVNEMSTLNNDLKELTKRINQLENSIERSNRLVAKFEVPEIDNILPENQRKIAYKSTSLFIGANVRENNSFVTGFRWQYNFTGSNFALMPETFLGFGKSTYFGLFTNVVYQINDDNTRMLNPYLGAGVGVLKTQKESDNDIFKGAYNVILGTRLPQFLDGGFYLDLNIRNTFKYNQLTIGYNLPF